MPQNTVENALEALRNGDPVLVYDADGREGEVDMIYAAEKITPEKVARLRNDAGGLICVALSHKVAEILWLPFYTDVVNHPAVEQGVQDYGDRSSFSLWVNHKDTYTGITDKDRAKTITALATATAQDSFNFEDEFETPGHVATLRAAEGLLEDRQGHTEMGVYLTQLAGLNPAAVVCEMLDDETGEALSQEAARTYVQQHGFMFITGEALLNRFNKE